MRQLRYTRYKDSEVQWLGRIPAHWNIMRLKFAATHNDEALPEETDPDYEIEYVDISSVDLVAGIQKTDRMPFEKAPSRARRKARDGDTIISTVRTYLKAITTVNNPPENLIVSTGFAVVRPGPNILPRYLGYYTKSQGFVDAVVANSFGVSYPAINASELVRLPIVYPPLDEQRAIVRFLNAKTAQIDELIAKKERLLQLLAEQRAAWIAKTVTKGFDPSAPRKQTNIPYLAEVPAHWRVATPLKYLVCMSGGGTPKTDESRFWDGEIPWVSPKDMRTSEIIDSTDHVSGDAIRETNLSLLPVNCVLIVVRGMILAHTFPVAINKKSVTINQDMKALHPVGSLSHRYLAFLLRGLSPFFLSLVQPSAHGTLALRTDVWSRLVLPEPPLEEQEAIAGCIEEITARIAKRMALIRDAIDKLREYRASLISAAVTGQIDVRSYELKVAAQ